MNNTHYISALPTGTILSSGARNYRVVKVLGQGGYGITYLATAKVKAGNVWVNGQFAIKEHFDQKLNYRVGTTAAISNPSTEMEIRESIKSFMVESKRLSELHHPNIVPVNESFEANNTAYYVMQYIDGGNLTEMVKNAPNGRLPEDFSLSIIKQVADAIRYLHSQRMTHLDVKPDNIVVQDWNTPILIDFGLVKRYDATGKPTATNKAAGVSDGYAPLEQYAGLTEFTPEADVYALAATLLFMLTGRTPYKAGQMSEAVIRSWLSGVSNHVVNAIVHGMTVLKDYRTKSVRQFVAELDISGSRNSEQSRSTGGSFEEKMTYTKGKGTSTQKMTAKVVRNSIARKNVKTGAIVTLVMLCIAVATALFLHFGFNELIFVVGFIAIFSIVTIFILPIVIGRKNTVNIEPRADEVITVNGVSFKMIGVQGGEFTMGATLDQGTKDIYNVHTRKIQRVTLSTFSIGETEVTQELWQAVMGFNPSNFKGPRRPVEEVSWEDCRNFIRKLNNLTGRRFRLPTEAEWEYAARGGNKGNGHKYAGSSDIGNVAWFSGNSGGHTHDVATKQPNELGLYDMSGNVYEWCQDWYGPYESGSQTNPTGATSGSTRVSRGGGWNYNARYCRVSNRGDYTPSRRFYYLGLRLAF